MEGLGAHGSVHGTELKKKKKKITDTNCNAYHNAAVPILTSLPPFQVQIQTSVYCSQNVPRSYRDRLSHPYKVTGNIIVPSSPVHFQCSLTYLAIMFHKEGYDQTNSVLWIDSCSLLRYPLQSLGSPDTSHITVSSRQYLTSWLITFTYEFLRFRSSWTGVSVLLRYNAASLGNRFLNFNTT
jgi:hypothetical protein